MKNSAFALHRNGSNRWTAKRRCVLLAVLLVCLTLPQLSESLVFGFFSDDNDDSRAGKATVTKPTKLQQAVEKKFKFHKIERVYVEEDDGNFDDDIDDDVSVGARDDDDGDIDISVRRRKELDSSAANEDEEYQFVRVRKAQKGTDRSAGKANKKKSKETVDSEETSSTKSFLGELFSGFFGGSGEGKVEAESEESAEQQSPVVEPGKSNSIIDWLKWLTESKETKVPEKVIENGNSENWLHYFNRWPFNSFFPIGQPAKPIQMPRQSRNGISAERNGNNDSADNDSEDAAMSEAHFESLLHTLPGFVVNSAYVQNTECRQQLQIFQRQLRGHKLWTLQMLDATGKVPSGLLRGNTNQFGDFELCTQVKTVVKVTPTKPIRIRGKYCLAHIETQATVPELKLPVHLAHGRGLWNGHLGNPGHFVPRYAVANWGICIPHVCPGSVVQEMLERNLRPYNNTGVAFHVEVNEQDCFVNQSKRLMKLLKKDNKFGVSIFYLSSLVLIMTVSFVYEHWKGTGNITKTEEKSSDAESKEAANDIEVEADNADDSQLADATEADTVEIIVALVPSQGETDKIIDTPNTSMRLLLEEIFLSFSPKRTLSELLSRERADVEFPQLHVLKIVATFMMYVCLKYLMIGHLPITNRDKLVRAMDQPLSIVFRAPFIYTDTLLLISGFLAAYQLSAEMEHKTYIQLLKRMSSKVARYLPALYVVLFFQTWILPYMDSGPLWTNLIGQNAQLCAQQMWRNLFSVQNAIDFEETCSPMTIQLGLEVQLYLLGPLIVWLYYTDSDAGFLVYGAVQALSVGARYSRTQSEHLSMTLFHGMNVSKFYRTANILYSSPISRATPYLLGIGGGLLYRVQGGNLDIAPQLIPVGWITCAISIFWCFWAPSAGMKSDFVYSAQDAATYAAWSPLILGLSICWIIFMFPNRNNSVLRFLTNARPILLLSRMCFPIQLVMYVVVLYNTAGVKESIKYQVTDLINFNEIGLILVFAVTLAFIIDIPSQRIRNLIVNRIFIERPTHETMSGAEPSEGDISEAHSEPATNDTPEPIENIWGTDADEEERLSTIIMRKDSELTPKIDASEEDKEQLLEEVTENVITEETDSEQVEEEVTEEEEEDDTDITEEDEVKKRPESPSSNTKDDTPIVARRRRPNLDNYN